MFCPLRMERCRTSSSLAGADEDDERHDRCDSEEQEAGRFQRPPRGLRRTRGTLRRRRDDEAAHRRRDAVAGHADRQAFAQLRSGGQSAFEAEAMVRQSRWVTLGAYLLVQNILGILFVALGLRAVQ